MALEQTLAKPLPQGRYLIACKACGHVWITRPSKIKNSEGVPRYCHKCGVHFMKPAFFDFHEKPTFAPGTGWCQGCHKNLTLKQLTGKDGTLCPYCRLSVRVHGRNHLHRKARKCKRI